MANMKNWILEMAGGDIIEAVVLGGARNPGNIPNYERQPKYTVLTWHQAEPWIDYVVSERGEWGANALWAWSPRFVIAIGAYDGRLWPFKLPRYPINGMPKYITYEKG